MSWSISITGTKEGVKAKVAEQMDKIAAGYAGKPEADDVVAAKGRIVALVDACDLTPDPSNWNAVEVKADGSHYTTTNGIGSGRFQVQVTRTSLAL